MTLTAGSAVRSGHGGSAVLVYPDGSRTQLAEDAEILIVDLSGRRNGRTSRVRLNLVTGQTQHSLSGDGSLEVEAAGAVAESSQGDYEAQLRGAAFRVRPRRVILRVGHTSTYLGAGEQGFVKGGRVQVAKPVPQRNGQAEPRPTAVAGQQNPAPTVTPPGQQRERETPSSREGSGGKRQRGTTPKPQGPKDKATRPGR
jgi:hypothetical protein